jgi:hypothetical protein
MSLFGKFKSFFEAVGSELEKLFGSAGFEQKVVAVISYAAPIVETIAQLAGGPAASALVTNIINAIKTDLATVSAVVQGGTVAAGTPTATTVETALKSIQTNLASLLSAADIKSSAKAGEITTYVNLLSGEVNALLAGLTAAPTVPAAPAVKPA